MILYEVKYKKINSLFWKKIKKVKGDFFIEHEVQHTDKGPIPISYKDIRCFILEDESRIEISCQDMIFKISKDRWMSIQQRMNIEAGQSVPIDKR